MKLFFIQNKAFNVNPSALREILNPYNNIDKTYLHSYDTQMTSAWKKTSGGTWHEFD